RQAFRRHAGNAQVEPHVQRPPARVVPQGLGSQSLPQRGQGGGEGEARGKGQARSKEKSGGDEEDGEEGQSEQKSRCEKEVGKEEGGEEITSLMARERPAYRGPFFAL